MDDEFLGWDETYAVGHLGLDLEHKHLVELINEMSSVGAGADEVQHLSQLSIAFHLASVEHFRHENSVMRDLIMGAYVQTGGGAPINEGAINDHCAEHARALIKLESMLHAFGAGRDRQMLASGLRAWFLDHAINHDSHLKGLFQTGIDPIMQPDQSRVATEL